MPPSDAHHPSAIVWQLTIGCLENYEGRCFVDIGALVPIQSDEDEEDDEEDEEDEASSTSLLDRS